MKTILFLLLLFTCFIGNAQSIYGYWYLNKLETNDTIINFDNEPIWNTIPSINFLFAPLNGGVLPNVVFTFYECAAVESLSDYDYGDTSIEIDFNTFNSYPPNICDDEEVGYLTVIFIEEFLTNSDSETWQNHFEIEFFTDLNTLSFQNLKITNISNGTEATFNEGLVIGNREFEKSLFSIYPNPAKDKIFIENESLAIQAIQIFNLQGKQMLLQKEVVDGSHTNRKPS